MSSTQNFRSTIEDKLKHHYQLPPNELQDFLKELSLDSEIYEICPIIIELMYSSRHEKERLHSATSLNYLIRQCFQNIEKNISSANKGELYSIYRDLIATRNPNSSSHEQELEEWKLAKITFKIFTCILEDFEENEFTPQMQEIYANLNLNHKILLQNFIATGDIEQKARDLFLEETLENYFILGLQQLEHIEQLKEKERLEMLEGRFLDYLLNLKKTIKLIEIEIFENKNKKRFFKELSQKNEFFKFIHKCISLTDQNTDENQPIILFNCKGSSKKQSIVNQIKALGLEIFCSILSFYSYKSVVEDFDSNKFLGLMETIIPQIITEMSNMKQNELSLDYNEKLAIGALKTIKKSYSFVFMNNELMKKNNEIFWRIIYPLLSVTSEEIRSYKDESEIVIAQIESIVEMEDDDIKIIESCKTYAAKLLEKMVSVIDTSLAFLFEGIMAIMEAEINKNSNEITKEIEKVYGAKSSLETCFTVISVLWSPIKKRPDLTKQIREFFYTYQSELLSLREIEKVRLISYLTYNFELIFSESPDEKETTYSPRTNEYYIMINSSLEENELIMKCCLDFIENQHMIEPSAFEMVERLFELIEYTKSSEIFSSIKKILKVNIPKIKFEQVIHILHKYIKRIEVENEQYIKALENKQIYSDLLMIRCFQSVRQIVEYYTQNEKGERSEQVMGIVWKIFEYMENISKASYAEDLIEIFNHMLLSLKTIDGPDFFQFLPFYESYHLNSNQLGNIFYTYNILITKGKDYLKNTKEGNAFINQITANTFICLDSRYVLSSYISIILLQYIFAFFPEVVSINHEHVFNVTKQILDERKNELDEEKESAIFNLWIIGSAISDHYDLGGFDNLNLKGIYGYHAKAFALGIYLKVGVLIQDIKKSSSEENARNTILKIGYLLRKSTEFIKIYNEFNRKIEIDLEEMIENIAKINPYNEIKEAITMVKNNLLPEDYDSIIKEIEKEISISDLRKLLGKAEVGERIFYAFK